MLHWHDHGCTANGSPKARVLLYIEAALWLSWCLIAFVPISLRCQSDSIGSYINQTDHTCHAGADDKAAAALAGLLASSRVLERLVLTNTSITDAGAQLLCNALQVGGG